ncbi:MAG: fluoride efflux transporter CrcB [Proteobacteria bacterium]|nr:fluoride efflux transporter CrcB [Pseudomonadota bacterium]
MQTAFLVFLGGGIGSVLRWLVGLGALRWLGPAFPWGTLAVNLLGGLAMGLLARLVVALPSGGQEARFFLMTGILGGFTTFSAFSLDAATLWMRGETGQAALYVAISVAGALGALAAGLWLGGVLAGGR